MMKRLVCLLLALMLPCAALAEPWQAAVTWQAEELGLMQLISALTGEDDASLAKGLKELADGLKVNLSGENDDFQAEVLWQDEALLTFGAASDAEGEWIVSSLWPGYKLSAEAADADAQLHQLDENIDWLALGTAAMEELTTWLGALPMEEETGHFIGDAYVNGRVRRTYRMDDRDVARLIDGLLMLAETYLSLDSAAMTEMLGMDLFQEIRRANEAVAQENMFAYECRQVFGPEGETVGFSLTVLEEGKQVSTLSVGIGDGALRAVWGYGMNQVNYYLDAQAAWDEETETAALRIRLYQDASHAGYQAARDLVYNSLLYDLTGRVAFTEGSLQQAELAILQPPVSVESVRYLFTNGDEGMRLELFVGNAETPCMTLQAAVSPAEAPAVSLDDLHLQTLEDAAASAAFDAVVEVSMQELMLKLIKALPAEILTNLLY